MKAASNGEQLNNRDHVSQYWNNKYANDKKYWLALKLLSRLCNALVSYAQGRYIIKAVCSLISGLLNGMNFLMSEEMNRDNIELYHVEALSALNITDEEWLRQAALYKKVPPLLKKNNRSKRASKLQWKRVSCAWRKSSWFAITSLF